MISDIFAKESIISYFRSDIIAGPEGFGKNLQNLDSMQLGSGFGGIRFPHVEGSDSLSLKDYLDDG
jgi:hypothetical protein